MALLKRPAMAADERPVPEAMASRGTLVALMQGGATAAARRGAVQDLAADPTAARDMASSLLEERDPAVRAALLAALVAIGSDDAADGIAAAACAEDALLRNMAVDALRELGAGALPQVERLLASPQAEQRIVAVGLLEPRRDPHARALLHGALHDDPDLNVGLAVVEQLSMVGDPGDLAALDAFAARHAGDAFVAFAVQVACRRAGGDA